MLLNVSPSFNSDGFTETLLRLQTSPTYGVFCERVYGRNLHQFNVFDEEQLQSFIASTNLNESHSVLDLGCGGGFIAEYVSDATGAQVTGIDFCPDVIESAQRRTLAKVKRLKFVTGDFNSLPTYLSTFDLILAVDTLYFADDLLQLLSSLKAHLRQAGKLALFHSYKQKDGDTNQVLLPTHNKLGTALTASGFSFQTIDYSSNELAIWEKALQAANDLKDSFEQEGNQKTYEGRIYEATRTLNYIKVGRSRRSYYLATLSRS